MVLRADELQLTRGESVRDTALVLSRHVAAIGLRTGREERLRGARRARRRCPVVNMLSPGHHPLPGARRPADAARGVRRARGPRARLRRRRQQRRALAGDRSARWPASRCASRRPPASSSSERTARMLDRRPGRGGRRRRRASTPTSGSRWATTRRRPAARREALAPYRLDDALLDRAAPRRDRAALPARPPRRGDHRGGPLRRPPARSGTRPRTAATRRRRCSSCSLRLAVR